MEIKALNVIDEALSSDIRSLEAVVNASEGLHCEAHLDNSINFSKEMNWLYLAYENEKLIGVLSLFAPTRNEAEFSAATLPDRRMRSVYKGLLASALAEIRKYEIPSVLLLCEPQSASGKEAMAHLGARYEFAEYSMRFDIARRPAAAKGGVALRKAAFGDTLTMVQLGQQIFGGSYEENLTMVVNTLAAESRDQYLALVDEVPVGMCCISYKPSEASIFGLGISPEFQGKGYGRDMLSGILDIILSSSTGSIVLDVNSRNDKAFSLYKSSGFDVTSCFEYHRLTAEELAQKVGSPV